MKRVAMVMAGAAIAFATAGVASATRRMTGIPTPTSPISCTPWGIYGQKDYNAWIGKIMCKRMYNNVDTDAAQTATFVRNQLDRDSSTEQVWQFVGAGRRLLLPPRKTRRHRPRRLGGKSS